MKPSILLLTGMFLLAWSAPAGFTAGETAAPVPAFHDGDVILFQGDSITDGNRGRSLDPNHILGHGYQFILAANFGGHHPELHLSFLNRGISGNTVADLQKRWEKDTLSLKPTVLSILIGVNDLGHGVSAEDYEARYDQLLETTVKAMPNIRLILCEPFGLPVGSKKDKWESYRPELQKRQAIVEKLAGKYHAPVVHFQKAFDDACKRAPADYWIWDGVHPTYNGHQLMADEWTRAVTEFWGR